MSLLQMLKFRGKTGDTMADKNYLHTAYANSADGTDGFTTVYPNLNLLNFKSGLKLGINLVWADGVLPMLNPSRAVFDYVSVIPGTTYTINSNWDKTERIAIHAYDSNDGRNATFIYDGSSAKWVSPSTIGRVITQKTTLSIPDGMNFIRVGFFAKDTSATLTLQDMLDAKTKVEQGFVATPWIPSASEVKTADWPKYVGTYVDTNPVSSTDPSKYVWDEMKYRVYLDSVPVGGSKLLSFDLGNLKAGTSYNIQVSQINCNIESDKSESVAFKTTLTQ